MPEQIETSAKSSSAFSRGLWLLYIGMIGLITSAVLLFGFLALMIVPAPTANSAFTVSGPVASISEPRTSGDDLQITLQDGRTFYVNRANEVAYLNWQQMREDVQAGDTIHLTIVKPIAWQLATGDNAPQNGPVAGIWTDETVYMDSTIPAKTWTAQAGAMQNALFSFSVLMVLLIVAGLMKGYGRLQLRTA